MQRHWQVYMGYNQIPNMKSNSVSIMNLGLNTTGNGNTLFINNNTVVIYCSKLLLSLSQWSLDSKYRKYTTYAFYFQLFLYTQIKSHSRLKLSVLFSKWCMFFSWLQSRIWCHQMVCISLGQLAGQGHAWKCKYDFVYKYKLQLALTDIIVLIISQHHCNAARWEYNHSAPLTSPYFSIVNLKIYTRIM